MFLMRRRLWELELCIVSISVNYLAPESMDDTQNNQPRSVFPSCANYLRWIIDYRYPSWIIGQLARALEAGLLTATSDAERVEFRCKARSANATP